MIRRIMKFSMLLVLVFASLTACHRQKLEEIIYTKALIPVLIDWETRALLYIDDDPNEDLYSASVWLFPRSESEYQGEPLEYRLDNAIYDYIDVPVGVYDVLVFNKTVGEFSSNVGFRGMDKFETFEYYTKPYLNDGSEKVFDGDRELHLEPDMLAAWRSVSEKPLVVTEDMIRQLKDIVICRDYLTDKYNTSKSESIASKITPSDFDDLSEEMRQLIDLKAERLTHITPIKEYAKNLHSAKVAVGTLSGMSSSVKLAGAEYSTTQTAHRFLFTDKTLESKDHKDGYMTAEFRVIGPLHIDLQADCQLKSQFTLTEEIDGSTSYPASPNEWLSTEVSPQVYHGQQHLGLDKVIPIEVRYDLGITLPDVEFGSEGFDVNVNDWDDEIVVPLN